MKYFYDLKLILGNNYLQNNNEPNFLATTKKVLTSGSATTTTGIIFICIIMNVNCLTLNKCLVIIEIEQLIKKFTWLFFVYIYFFTLRERVHLYYYLLLFNI